MFSFLLTIGFFLTLMVAAGVAIYKYNQAIVKRKCRDWDGAKSLLFFSKFIGPLQAGIPSWVTDKEKREELSKSDDYRIIAGQARWTYVQIVVVLLIIFIIFGLVLGAISRPGAG